MLDKYIDNVFGVNKVVNVYKGKRNRECAECVCINCGKVKHYRLSDLISGKCNSCNCNRIKYSHDKNHRRLYRIWSHMKYRCNTYTCDAYKNYGEKGIKICSEWNNDFSSFKTWAINSGYEPNLTIDRIDSNKGYSPDNCRWITLGENVANANRNNQRRFSNRGEYYGIHNNGEYYTFINASQFAREHGLDGRSIRYAANNNREYIKDWEFGFVKER